MLDLRIYRAALLPVLLALIVVAFSLEDRPEPLRTAIPAEAFDGARALRVAEALQRTFPQRRTGSAQDARLATIIEGQLRLAMPGVPVVRSAAEAHTIDGDRRLVTVRAQVPGSSSAAPLVVVAARDTEGRGGVAQLTGTAAMIELARIVAAARPRRSVIFASVSGSTGGQGGMRALLAAVPRPLDAVIELGDMGGPVADRPLVVPWSSTSGTAPQRLQRTVALALRREARITSPTPRATSQIARMAWPVTLAGQGVALADGVPAVRVSATGELPPSPTAPVAAERVERFGRTILRSLTALQEGPRISGVPARQVIFQKRVIPSWALRLLAFALLLPALLTALDALARLRRRGGDILPWLAWTLSFAAPLALAVLFARVLGLVGVVPATAPPPLPSAAPLDGAAWAALACTAVVLALGFLVLRPLLGRRLVRTQPPQAAGAALAPAIIACLGGLLACVLNPSAALLLVLPANLWLIRAAGGRRPGPRLGVLVVLVSLVPALLVAISLAAQLTLGPGDFAWFGFLVLAGGQGGILASLGWSVIGGAAIAAAVVAWRATGPKDRAITVRGPASYAGPGSLGGTDSAMRR
ncbi:unannotated protein [freshwater metagenome]|uniref:Unannotated protein n=1 Tax=freshwater metagenome TaxID=449393 RepID=A0A6J7H2I3_9ZZZZ|nr:hypothetical protein [Actinomycetota bacterium]